MHGIPAHLKDVPIYQLMWMVHLPLENRSKLLEDLRKKAIDDGCAEDVSDDAWRHMTSYQELLDMLKHGNEEQYRRELDAMRDREIQNRVSYAVIQHLHLRSTVSSCLEVAKSVLNEYGVADDPEWAERVQDYRDYDTDILEEAFYGSNATE